MRTYLLLPLLALFSFSLWAQPQTFTYSVYFDLDKHELRADAREVLDQIPEKLTLTKAYDIEIQAHTDARGGNNYNYELSRRRAGAVLDYLAGQRLHTSDALLRSFGEDHP